MNRWLSLGLTAVGHADMVCETHGRDFSYRNGTGLSVTIRKQAASINVENIESNRCLLENICLPGSAGTIP